MGTAEGEKKKLFFKCNSSQSCEDNQVQELQYIVGKGALTFGKTTEADQANNYKQLNSYKLLLKSCHTTLKGQLGVQETFVLTLKELVSYLSPILCHSV